MSLQPPWRIHIVGISPRTGTTLLAECMVACMNIDAFEPHEASVARLRFGARIYLTKRPGDLAAVGTRLRLDPHFHTICLMRDPRDVVVSRHGKDRDRYWASLRIWKSRVAIVRALTPHPRFTLVRYEDLVTDPDGTAARLVERLPFLRLDYPFTAYPALAAPAADALDALGRVRAFDTGSIGNWQKHLPRLAGQLAQWGPITDELVEFGYEHDGEWLSRFDGVIPDLSASRLDGGGRRWRRFLKRSVLPWVSAGAAFVARKTGLPVA